MLEIFGGGSSSRRQVDKDTNGSVNEIDSDLIKLIPSDLKSPPTVVGVVPFVMIFETFFINHSPYFLLKVDGVKRRSIQS